MIAEILYAVLTETQVDRLIGILSRVVEISASIGGVILPAMLLYFQKRNFNRLSDKQDAATEASQSAIKISNGHNEKIIAVAELVHKHVTK